MAPSINRSNKILLLALVLFAGTVLGLFVVGCGRTSQTLPNTTAPSPTLAVSTQRTMLPSPTPTSPAAPFWLENTNVRMNSGRGNIAWSHNGEWLAYTHGYSVWVVRVDQWYDSRNIFPDLGSEWTVDDFIAWSPDDSMIGVTLERAVGQFGSEGFMAQVDWRRRSLSFLAPEQALLVDWNARDQILVNRDFDFWTFDRSTLAWKRLTITEPAGNYILKLPHWGPDGSLLLAGSEDMEVLTEYSLFVLDLEANRTEVLPVQAIGDFTWPPYPVASPDGRWIAWIERPTTDLWRIMLYDRQSRETAEVANTDSNGTFFWSALAWAPDSKRLAFSAEHFSGGYEYNVLWLAHINLPSGIPAQPKTPSAAAIEAQNKYNNVIWDNVADQFRGEDVPTIAKLVKRQISRESQFVPSKPNLMGLREEALEELKQAGRIEQTEGMPRRHEDGIRLGVQYLRYLWDLLAEQDRVHGLHPDTQDPVELENRLKTAMAAYMLGRDRVLAAHDMARQPNEWDSIRQCLAPDQYEGGTDRIQVKGKQSAEQYVTDIFSGWDTNPAPDHPPRTPTPGGPWQLDPAQCQISTSVPATPTRRR